MITGLHIENFKGISESKVDEIGMVNIFIGKNDSCKSTIMEAAYAVLKESYSSGLSSVVSRRTHLPTGSRELWYGYKIDNDISISVFFDGVRVATRVTYDKRHGQINSTSSLFVKGGGATRVFDRLTIYQSNFSLSTSSGASHLFRVAPGAKKENYAEDATFIDSSSRNDLQLIESILGQLKLRGLDLDFGNFLSQVFETDPRWEFMPHPDFPDQYRVALSKGNNRVFLNGFGDGIRFCMLLIGRSMLSENTALFIEEIENNQHPDSLAKMVPFLADTSKKNNLQLFITTHSPLVMRLFEEHFKTGGEKSKLRIYRVSRNERNGAVQCTALTEEELAEWFTKVDQDLFGWKTEEKE
jgi:predicted ATPase